MDSLQALAIRFRFGRQHLHVLLIPPPKKFLFFCINAKKPKMQSSLPAHTWLLIPGAALHSQWLFRVLTCLLIHSGAAAERPGLRSCCRRRLGYLPQMTHFQVEEMLVSASSRPPCPGASSALSPLSPLAAAATAGRSSGEGEGASGEESGLTSSPSHNRDTRLDKGNVHPIVRNSPKCLLGAGCQEWRGKMALATVCHLSSCTPLGTLMIFSSYVVLALRPHYLCRAFP